MAHRNGTHLRSGVNVGALSADTIESRLYEISADIVEHTGRHPAIAWLGVDAYRAFIRHVNAQCDKYTGGPAPKRPDVVMCLCGKTVPVQCDPLAPDWSVVVEAEDA